MNPRSRLATCTYWLPGTVAVLAAAALAVAGCSADRPRDTVPELRVVTGGVNGAEYRFDLPDRVTAGATRISLVNEGSEEHHAQLFQLQDGATVSDLATALAAGDPAAVAEMGTFYGGTGLVAPGETSRADALVELTPGDYVLVCFVEDSQGRPHLAHGMLDAFSVTPTDSPPLAQSADDEVGLVDYGFELPDMIDGDATLAITNASAAEHHEMVVGRLDNGVDAGDVVDALDAGGPLPAVGVGGVQAIPPSTTQHLRLDLEPGRYVLVCAVPSPNGTPHYKSGMIQEVTVT